MTNIQIQDIICDLLEAAWELEMETANGHQYPVEFLVDWLPKDQLNMEGKKYVVVRWIAATNLPTNKRETISLKTTNLEIDVWSTDPPEAYPQGTNNRQSLGKQHAWAMKAEIERILKIWKNGWGPAFRITDPGSKHIIINNDTLEITPGVVPSTDLNDTDYDTIGELVTYLQSLLPPNMPIKQLVPDYFISSDLWQPIDKDINPQLNVDMGRMFLSDSDNICQGPAKIDLASIDYDNINPAHEFRANPVNWRFIIPTTIEYYDCT